MLIKRLFDILAASTGLVLLAPVFAAAALAIRLDSPGPALFRQERVGKGGVPFLILKFRTMYVGAEARGQITRGADPRVTPVGAVLRRWKIDELPQLVNVVRGEMSLVGPRPEVPRYVACYPAAVREAVLSVQPGITDWASICFREEGEVLGTDADPERRYVEEILPIKLDYCMRYVNDHGFFTDLKIIFMTLRAIVR